MTVLVIGPTFPIELLAAGLPLNGISWDPVSGVLFFNDDYDSDMQDRARAVFSTHDPTAETPDQMLADRIKLGMNVLANAKGVPVAVYALDAVSNANLTGIGNIVTLTGQFPGPSSTFDYPDINGATVTFPDIDSFKSFMTFYSGLLLDMNNTAAILNTGADADWPSQDVTPT